MVLTDTIVNSFNIVPFGSGWHSRIGASRIQLPEIALSIAFNIDLAIIAKLILDDLSQFFNVQTFIKRPFSRLLPCCY